MFNKYPWQAHVTHCANNALGKERLPEKLASLASACFLSVSSFYAPADRQTDDACDGLPSAAPGRYDAARPDGRPPPPLPAAPPLLSPSTPLVTDTARARPATPAAAAAVAVAMAWSPTRAAPPVVRCGPVNLKFGDAAMPPAPPQNDLPFS